MKNFTIIGGNTKINFEIGHTEDEWKDLVYGDDYSYITFWDFSIDDLLNGAIEPNDDMLYWLIDGRLYETPYFIEPEYTESDEKYSVFYKYGDEANDNYLTKKEAMKLATELEKDKYEVIVAKLLPNDEWSVVYETK